MRSFASQSLESGPEYVWTARVRQMATGPVTGLVQAAAYVRSQSFVVQGQASFKEADEQPAAVDYLLGALGADVLCGFAAVAARRGIAVEALEVSISGRLDNPLVHLGVVGESGHAGFACISGTLYVSADADEAPLQEVWQETLRRSPLVNTLQRGVELLLEMQVTL